MHYYTFNIGDYASHTSRLSQSEDLAYRRLLDLYYLTERPFNGSSTDVAREIGMVDQLESVEFVLKKYFSKETGEWVNSRADKEIKLYQSKVTSAKRAGVASGKARRSKVIEQPLIDRSTDVEPTNNQEPITKKHKEEKKRAVRPAFVPPTTEEVKTYCDGRSNGVDAQAFIDFYESKGWVIGKAKMKSWQACVRTWESRAKSNEPTKPAYGANAI